jgi:hypothetical protein
MQQPQLRLQLAESSNPFASRPSSGRSSRQHFLFCHLGSTAAGATQGRKYTQPRATSAIPPTVTWGNNQIPVNAGLGGRNVRRAGLAAQHTTCLASGRPRGNNGRTGCRMLRAAPQRHRALMGAALVAGTLLGLNDSRLSSKRAVSPGLMRLHT